MSDKKTVDYYVYDEHSGDSWQESDLKEAERSLKERVSDQLNDDGLCEDAHRYSGVYQKIRRVELVNDDKRENYNCTSPMHRIAGYEECTDSCDNFDECSDENPNFEPWPHDSDHEFTARPELKAVGEKSWTLEELRKIVDDNRPRLDDYDTIKTLFSFLEGEDV